MSTWTNERHEEARKALHSEFAQWCLEYAWDALDEIERLRAALNTKETHQ